MVTRIGNVWVFRIECPRAQRVYLVGEFNAWSVTSTPMTPTEPGVWQISLSLPPGEYRFRYCAMRGHWVTDGPSGRPKFQFSIDEQWWMTDYAAFGLSPRDGGEWDSVLWVPPPPAPAPPQPPEAIHRQTAHAGASRHHAPTSQQTGAEKTPG